MTLAAQRLKRPAIRRARRAERGAVQGTQHDSDHERGGGQLPVPDGYARADRLQRDVHRAGSRAEWAAGPPARRSSTGTATPTGWPGRYPADGPAWSCRARGRARRRPGLRRVRRADAGQVATVQRASPSDDPAGLGQADVLDVPQPGHHAPSRVADHRTAPEPPASAWFTYPDSSSPGLAGHRSRRRAAGSRRRGRWTAGRRDPARQRVERGGAAAVARDQEDVTRPIVVRGRDGG